MPFIFYCILAALLLLLAYAGLLVVEARQGVRYFARYRERLDEAARQARFIARHVDFGSFVREETVRAARYLAHESAHLALQAVRSVERLLTRLVRRLRLHPEAPLPPGESARQFVRALSDFRIELSTSRPEMRDVR